LFPVFKETDSAGEHSSALIFVFVVQLSLSGLSVVAAKGMLKLSIVQAEYFESKLMSTQEHTDDRGSPKAVRCMASQT
jgi:hypothetical protein